MLPQVSSDSVQVEISTNFWTSGILFVGDIGRLFHQEPSMVSSYWTMSHHSLRNLALLPTWTLPAMIRTMQLPLGTWEPGCLTRLHPLSTGMVFGAIAIGQEAPGFKSQSLHRIQMYLCGPRNSAKCIVGARTATCCSHVCAVLYAVGF